MPNSRRGGDVQAVGGRMSEYSGSNCLVCGTLLTSIDNRTMGDWTDFDCPRCGKYSLTGTMIAVATRGGAPSRMDGAKLSHAIRKAQSGGRRPRITTEVWDRILESTDLPAPAQQGN